MIDVNTIQSLAGKQSAEVIAAIERMAKECLSARAMRHAKSMLRAIKNDRSLEAPIRASADSLWRKLCTLRPEPKSIPTASAGTTPRVVVHKTDSVHRDCKVPIGRPCLDDPLLELLVYEVSREEFAGLETKDEILRAVRERDRRRAQQ